VRVLRIARGFRQYRIVVENHAHRTACQSRRTAGLVVRDIADPVHRSSERGLVAKRVRGMVDQHVSHDANVVHAAIGLNRLS